MKKLQNIGAKLSVLPLLLMPASVLAQANLPQLGDVVPDQLEGKGSIGPLIGTYVGIFIGVLGIIFFLLTVYAGFLYLTAAGEDDKVDKAKKLLTQAIIGLVIVMASYAISNFVIDNLIATTN